jgi:hypothetical protein
MYIEDTLDEFTQPIQHGSRPGTLKRKAAKYLGKVIGEKLTKPELRKVEAKAKKIKKSVKKAERNINHQLVKQIDLVGA